MANNPQPQPDRWNLVVLMGSIAEKAIWEFTSDWKKAHSPVTKCILLATFCLSLFGIQRGGNFFSKLFHRLLHRVTQQWPAVQDQVHVGGVAFAFVIGAAQKYGWGWIWDAAVDMSLCLEYGLQPQFCHFHHEDVTHMEGALRMINDKKLQVCTSDAWFYDGGDLSGSVCHVLFNCTPLIAVVFMIVGLYGFVEFCENCTRDGPGPPPPPAGGGGNEPGNPPEQGQGQQGQIGAGEGQNGAGQGQNGAGEGQNNGGQGQGQNGAAQENHGPGDGSQKLNCACPDCKNPWKEDHSTPAAIPCKKCELPKDCPCDCREPPNAFCFTEAELDDMVARIIAQVRAYFDGNSDNICFDCHSQLHEAGIMNCPTCGDANCKGNQGDH